MRNFSVTLLDNDGETQEYRFVALTPWHVCASISATMRRRGDFYGHTMDSTMDVVIHELIPAANMQGAITA
jgi:hypothetical protein